VSKLPNDRNVRFGILVAGTNVQYGTGSARSAVVNVISLALQRKVTRALKRQNARTITSVIRSTPSYGTENVAASSLAYATLTWKQIFVTSAPSYLLKIWYTYSL